MKKNKEESIIIDINNVLGDPDGFKKLYESNVDNFSLYLQDCNMEITFKEWLRDKKLKELFNEN